MAAYRDRVYGARVIVTSCMAAYRDRLYGARAILTSLYGSVQGQSIWCRDNCKMFVWHLIGTQYMVQV